MTIKRRMIKRGEALAMLPEALLSATVRGRRAMYWDYYSSVPDNVRVGSVAVVNVMGGLDHHAGWCDSYESIVERVAAAISGDDVVDAALLKQAYVSLRGGDPASVEIPDAVPPSHVVFRIDSPGGLVSGLNQCVFKLRAMLADAGIPSVAYCDELAASAAYALACACDEIILPPSAIVGSVGVISHLGDQVEANKKYGVNVVTIASGTRKSDGDPNVPVSDEATSAEKRRVDRMAAQFFDLVAEARPLTSAAVKAYEAGIFMGQEAVDRGMADDVMSWDSLLESLLDASVNEIKVAKSGQPESTSTGASRANRAKVHPMSIAALTNLIKKTEAAYASANGPAKKRLGTALAAYKASLVAFKAATADMKKTKESYEKTTSEETGTEDAAAEDEAAAGDDEPDGDEGGEDDDEGGEEAASALLSLAEEATGRKGKRAVGAAAALFASAKLNGDRIAALEKTNRAAEKTALIADARGGRRITPHEAKTLAAKPLAFVRDFLDMRTGAVVDGDEQITLPDPNKSAPDTKDAAASLPPEVQKSVAQALRAVPKDKQAALRDKLVAAHVKAHNDRMAAANSGSGRY
jgi:ClpP class serine protease